MTPAVLTRPYVGLKPTTPQNAAGIRTEPAASVPIEPWRSLRATPAAEPLDVPPVMRVSSHGFGVTPKSGWGKP